MRSRWPSFTKVWQHVWSFCLLSSAFQRRSLMTYRWYAIQEQGTLGTSLVSTLGCTLHNIWFLQYVSLLRCDSLYSMGDWLSILCGGGRIVSRLCNFGHRPANNPPQLAMTLTTSFEQAWMKDICLHTGLECNRFQPHGHAQRMSGHLTQTKFTLVTMTQIEVATHRANTVGDFVLMSKCSYPKLPVAPISHGG